MVLYVAQNKRITRRHVALTLMLALNIVLSHFAAIWMRLGWHEASAAQGGGYDWMAGVLWLQENWIALCVSVVPMWPVATDRSNRFSVSVDHGKAEVCENRFKEWSREWKIQVLENRKEFVLTLPLDTTRNDHVMTLSIVDPGQIIQKITYQ